ncbi:hypothetical protein DY000_02039430 [Brassica cretica]|uniref:Uncharacterized protein n=1 Tax=Brassica cretica TaxID=69181 RepID=A0ABQ7BC42_BRACR|nr:hypothetical protein DY000_02039430 [Brassica cretica]
MDGDRPTMRLSGSFDTRYRFELAFQCHRSEVNPTVRSDAMHVLLKSGQSVSRERESSRGDEGKSIDGAPLVSIDGAPLVSIDDDYRKWAVYISRPT